MALQSPLVVGRQAEKASKDRNMNERSAELMKKCRTMCALVVWLNCLTSLPGDVFTSGRYPIIMPVDVPVHVKQLQADGITALTSDFIAVDKPSAASRKLQIRACAAASMIWRHRQ